MYLQQIIYAQLSYKSVLQIAVQQIKFKCSKYIYDKQMLSTVCSGEVTRKFLRYKEYT